MTRTVAKGAFYLLAILLLLWTGYRSYHLLGLTLPGNPVLPLLGVVIFDAGMVTWLLFFLKAAQGMGQRAVALIASLADLVLLVAANAADYWLSGQQLADVPADVGQWAIWTIVAATAVNITAAWLAHVTDPDAIRDMALRNAQDTIMADAYRQLRDRTAEIAGQVASDVSVTMINDAIAAIRGFSQNGRNPSVLPGATTIHAAEHESPPGEA